MIRVKRGAVARMKRKKLLKLASGFKGGSSRLIRTSKARVMKALSYSYTGRKCRKQYFKKVAIVRLNAFTNSLGNSYDSGLTPENRPSGTLTNPHHHHSHTPHQKAHTKNPAHNPGHAANTNKPSTGDAHTNNPTLKHWNKQPTPASRSLSLSKFLRNLKKHNVILNKKMLAQLCLLDSKAFLKLTCKTRYKVTGSRSVLFGLSEPNTTKVYVHCKTTEDSKQ